MVTKHRIMQYGTVSLFLRKEAKSYECEDKIERQWEVNQQQTSEAIRDTASIQGSEQEQELNQTQAFQMWVVTLDR